MTVGQPRTLFDKIWDAHEAVPAGPDHPAVIYVDTHLIHEVTSPQAFALLRERGLRVRRPDRTWATVDHSIPTRFVDGRPAFLNRATRNQVGTLERNCEEHRIPLFRMGDPGQGIVHVIGPELGLTQPGRTIVCGDSHTSTHGAFGAWAFGIGTTEVAQVLATQCLLQERPRTLGIEISGRLGAGVSAKDLILGVIRRFGVAAGRGHVIEYRGEAVDALDMEARMTLCNMSIEAGARAGLIAPDETTFEYLEGKEHVPSGDGFADLVARWSRLPTDDGAEFDRSLSFDAGSLEPMVTWGTNPGMSCGISEAVPAPADAEERAALDYMGIEAGRPLLGRPADVVFIGSCTNARISDLRAAARRPGRPPDESRHPTAGGSGVGQGSPPGGGGRARRGVPERRGRVAGAGLLDVHRHERGPAVAEGTRRFDFEPQLRGPARTRGPNRACLAGDCRRLRARRSGGRSAALPPGLNLVWCPVKRTAFDRRSIPAEPLRSAFRIRRNTLGIPPDSRLVSRAPRRSR